MGQKIRKMFAICSTFNRVCVCTLRMDVSAILFVKKKNSKHFSWSCRTKQVTNSQLFVLRSVHFSNVLILSYSHRFWLNGLFTFGILPFFASSFSQFGLVGWLFSLLVRCYLLFFFFFSFFLFPFGRMHWCDWFV